MTPRATMRLQLHKGFTFADAAAIVPYLVDLGVSHVYSSPILTARAGSMHGYDVIDPTLVNPELGGEDGLRNFVSVLRNAGLGLIVDIVPNHMAVGGSDNHWWNEVLRYGRASRFAEFFDVDWEARDADLKGKVLAPFLGKPYGEALDAGEVRLELSSTGEPVIRYFDATFPIDPADYAHVCESGVESFDPANRDGRFNLHALLERQHYRLAWWGSAGDQINWRRFFDINGLAGLRIEVPEVFEATHATLFRLYGDGLIDGFRVDHVDGLSDPPGYCRRLRQRLDELAPGRHAYLVVEKILGPGEVLPGDWGVDGTSGYDFMNQVSALQHDAAGAPALGELWHRLTNRPADFAEEEAPARAETLERGFEAQLMATARALHEVARSDRATRDISEPAIRRGLVALLSHFPVYRGYNAGQVRSASDNQSFQKAMAAARSAAPASLHPILDHLDCWLGGAPGHPVANTRFQQLSAPVAAKAVEDTAFYRYGRLLSRNDVGFDASTFGGSVEAFHRANTERLAHFPNAMLATATHDHKRGEDVRARLAIISEIPDQWSEFVTDCLGIVAGGPEPGDQIMLFQMILGAWPPDLTPSDAAGLDRFRERLQGWQQKALREAKLKTDWTTPNQEYEANAADFLFALLRPNSIFLKRAAPFLARIMSAGAVNGLAQAILKLTVPGMPDIFQGTEFWDLSLVDPDNRRPVDYHARQSALGSRGGVADLLAHWRDGHVKQHAIQRILALRQRMPEVFASGDYTPLRATGPREDHVVAFSRSLGPSAVIVVVPRLPFHLPRSEGSIRLDPDRLRGCAVQLPQAVRGMTFRPVLTDQTPVKTADDLSLDTLLEPFPAAVLVSVDQA